MIPSPPEIPWCPFVIRIPLSADCRSGARILIVDDQQENIKLLEAVLAAHGYVNLFSTVDATRALAHVRDLQPDLVLLDLHMPNVDGFDVLEQLAPHIDSRDYVPILVITADANPVR